MEKGPSAFVMRLSDDEVEDVDKEELHDRSLVVGSRFAFDELYLRFESILSFMKLI